MYETGAMRRVHLRGRQNILKRLLIHGAAFNLSLILRKVLGAGKPRDGGGALARGARVRLGAKIGLGITGIAGPGGETPGKRVGLTYVAIDSEKNSTVKRYEWTFDRQGNRLASVGAALDLLEELMA